MKKTIGAVFASVIIAVIASCGDDGPTGPSPLPTPETVTPTTPTTPGGTDTVPQVAGTYRGEGTEQHVPPGGGGIGPRAIDACTDVEQEGTTVTVEVPIDPWELRGTINREGRLENIELLEKDKRALYIGNVVFNAESLTVELSTSPTGSAHRFLMDLNVERQAPGTPECDRSGQTARPGNQS